MSKNKKTKKIHPTQNTNLVKVRTEEKPEKFSLGTDSTEGIVIHHYKVDNIVKYCKIAIGGRVLLYYNPNMVHPIGTVGTVTIEQKEVPTTGGPETRDVVVNFTATGVNQIVNNAIIKLDNTPEVFVAHKNIIIEEIVTDNTAILQKVVGRAGDNIFYTK